MRELSIFAAADENPTGDCLIEEGRALSFEDVAGRTAGAVEQLVADGARRGDRVALTPRPDVDSAVWLYALFELGAPAVLLHPALTEGERTEALRAAQPTRLIAEPAPSEPVARPELAPVAPEETLAVVYTSGSRGLPRGALLSRRAFVASADAHRANLGWRSDDRWLLAMPPSHVGGLSILTRCLIARRAVVLQSGPFDPASILRPLGRDRVTLMSVVPTMLQRLLDVEPSWTPGTGLRAVLVGGAPFSEALRRRAAERGVPALATYGCTEASSQVSTQTIEQVGQPGSGAPLPGVDVRIEDGEIQVRGEVVMDGYLDQEDADSPWTGDRWLRTGDSGRFLEDGQLEVLGRRDDLIITGGENVAPREVEEWLQSLPGIDDACVFALPDPDWGQRVAAIIVTDPGRYDAGALRDRMRDELAPHKRPKELAIVDAIPLNRVGKVDRSAVLERHRADLRPV